MKNTLIKIVFAGLFILPFASLAQGVKITGEVATPLTIDATTLHQFKQTTVTRKDKDGKVDHTYTGVTLSDILKQAGVAMEDQLKGKNLTKCVLVDAADNYEVAFALAELDKNYTDRLIILADTVDGKPLPTGEGPFRIIVQDEKKPARCVRQVTGLKVVFLK
ncbi:molybdopterin-dependent oxidoreductase [Mucilaginibacter sp. dw_454]|uniref:molybdopterin-dependent oxidoreductase n=1 Tax=Mucilaginibacter sp. dw_454 TaxID=2720079 RepID=UPI001BD5BD48|nr:molybdopterin-dependent oxidoreductase [Mucilaginibacter sp. dw_454]